ncbi:AAA family ATPase [Bacillus aerolatus]|uniref:Nuclease SbcCD subunit C n=1 Tax=Bacillus aerolatus TaxID=2653354 RepID=A0A6I1FLH2_9BACI|nr:AAA family ATPase [Bacillus aerolatus]KAB7707127.1 AAA family ATPase [Bacillus aerolatus]
MLLKKIILHNFRQYYGTQEINFSIGPKRNITVIHGENGSGKTALLNAFSWCLYGITDLPDSKRLINEYTVKNIENGSKAEMYIELHFTSRDIDYILLRKATYDKFDSSIKVNNTTVDLKFFKDGKWITLRNPIVQVNRMLPENLRNYFFFDGERIDSLARHEDNDEIRQAIKTIMDLEIIERSIRHTEEAKKEFLQNLSESSDRETKALISEQQTKEAEEKEYREEIEQLTKNISLIRKQKEDLDERLAKVESISEIQNERKRLEERKEKTSQKLVGVEKSINVHITKKGYLALTEGIEQRVISNLNSESYSAKETYPDLTAQLIEAILEQDRCLCGEDLISNKLARERVETLLQQVAPHNQYASMTELKGEIKLVKNSRQHFFTELAALQTMQTEYSQELNDINNLLEEKSAEISKRDSEDIQKLEQRRKECEEDTEKFIKELAIKEKRAEEITKELRDILKKLDKQQQFEQKAIIARKRYDLSVKLIETMQVIYSIKEEEVKKSLREKLKNVYSYFLRKDYEIDLTNEFKLIVKNSNGNKVAMSQGERQITSLSFIGAIVDIAREKYREKSSGGIGEGGIYPLVMDSPFGALDSDHRRRVSHGIHKLSDQIIVIVSTSQWKGEVEKEMKDFVGANYTLDYHDAKKNPKAELEYTQILEGN